MPVDIRSNVFLLSVAGTELMNIGQYRYLNNNYLQVLL